MKYIVALLIVLITIDCRGQDRPKNAAVDPALVAAVDSMLPKLEILSGLKKLKPVALAQQTRAELRKYIEGRIAEEMPPEELKGISLLYSQLGLIPDTLDIKALLLDLYQEQVAGYYDPATEKFYVIAGTPTDMLRTVLAHELVHALQDQHVDLDSLIARERGNDRQTAAQSAIEGHATLVMFAFLMQDATGKLPDPAQMPDIAAQMKPALEAQNSQFPIFKRTPRIIRETMIFPYVAGAGFVQHLWVAKKGYVAPFDTLLPQSTEQIMHPAAAFIDQRDDPTEVTLPKTAGVLHEGTLGELETGLLLSHHIGIDAESAAQGWDGDRFQVIERAGKKLVVWQTVWDSPEDAERFLRRYRQVAVKRPERVIKVERNVVNGREGVLVTDGER